MTDKEQVDNDIDSSAQDDESKLPPPDEDNSEEAEDEGSEQAEPNQVQSVAAPTTPSATPVAATTTATDPNMIDVLGTRPPAQNALQGFAQNMAVQQDLAGGKITPETYGSLFDKKSTLGKIGTLFGLMLSGAGSGLAHQSNLLMDMMNNEINRDLESQKANQSNKLNWYNAALQHETNLSNIALNAAHEQSVRMGTYNSGLDAELKNYRNSVVPHLARLSATTESANNMLSAAMQYKQDNVDRMAPGASKMVAQSQIDNVIRPRFNAQIMKNQQELAERKDAIHQIYPNPLKQAVTGTQTGQEVDPRGPAINNDVYQKGISLGRVAPGTPGSIPEAQVGAINAEANHVANNRNVYADWSDTFKKLQNMKLAGQVPGAKAVTGLLGLIPFIGSGAAHAGVEAQQAFERQRNIEKEAFKQRVGTNLGADEKEQLANSLLPSWNDTDQSSMEAWRKGVQHFKTLEANTQNLDQYGLKTQFPELPFQPPKSEVYRSSSNRNQELEDKFKKTPLSE